MKLDSNNFSNKDIKPKIISFQLLFSIVLISIVPMVLARSDGLSGGEEEDVSPSQRATWAAESKHSSSLNKTTAKNKHLSPLNVTTPKSLPTPNSSSTDPTESLRRSGGADNTNCTNQIEINLKVYLHNVKVRNFLHILLLHRINLMLET